MSIDEMIEALESLKKDHGGDTEVRVKLTYDYDGESRLIESVSETDSIVENPDRFIPLEFCWNKGEGEVVLFQDVQSLIPSYFRSKQMHYPEYMKWRRELGPSW